MKRLVLTLLLTAAITTPSFAQSGTTPIDPQASAQFSSLVGQPVSEALELIKQQEFSAALTILNRALALEDISSYERATIYQMMGSAYYDLDRPADAIMAFKNAVAAQGLTAAQNGQLELQIAKLQIVSGQYEAGAKALEAWSGSGGRLTPEDIELLVQAWVNAGDFEKALPWTQKWYERASPKTRKHFDLLNLVYHKLGRYKDQIDIVKDMINQWPGERELWQNLASLFMMTEQEYDAFIVNQLMYHGGFFTDEADILKLVQYYGYHEIPLEGAKILDAEMKTGSVDRSVINLRNLSTLWLQSREYDRAIPVLKRVTEISPDKESFAQLAETLITRGDCAGAEVEFQKSMGLGYPAGKPWMLIGTCHYEESQKLPKPECENGRANFQGSKRYHVQLEAKSAFEKVSKPTRLKLDAASWTQFIDAEQSHLDKNCTFIEKQEELRCFMDIKNGKSAMFMNGGNLILSDESCRSYVPAYEKAHAATARID